MPGEREEPAAVRVRGLVQSYSGVRAVQGIDLEIATGEIFVLPGPNGAGKTTTVEILLDEAQYLADRVAVIAAGQIVAEGPPTTLGHRDLAGARPVSAARCHSPNRSRHSPSWAVLLVAITVAFRRAFYGAAIPAIACAAEAIQPPGR